MFWSDRGHWPKLKIVHCGVEPARYTTGARDGTRLIFVGLSSGLLVMAVLGVYLFRSKLKSSLARRETSHETPNPFRYIRRFIAQPAPVAVS